MKIAFIVGECFDFLCGPLRNPLGPLRLSLAFAALTAEDTEDFAEDAEKN